MQGSIGKFSWILGIDLNDIFSLVMKHTSIRALLEIVASNDYEYGTASFMNDELEAFIFMHQSKGFITLGH